MRREEEEEMPPVLTWHISLSTLHVTRSWQTEQLLESQNQQAYSWKHKTEGEDEDLDNYPAQHLQARLVIATELLMEDCKFEVNKEVWAACEKAGIYLLKLYSEAVNNPIYGSKWQEVIHKELSALISFGTWNTIWQSKANRTISST